MEILDPTALLSPDWKDKMEHQMFEVKGMTCESCVEKITNLLETDAKVQNLKVTLNPPRIHFDSIDKYDSHKVNQALHSLGKYSVVETTNAMKADGSEPSVISKYIPLILLFALSAGVPALNMLINHSDLMQWMYQFMGVTLIALAYFKFLDLPKFAEAFSTYDPIAMRFDKYGYIYPFFELAAGIGFVLSFGVKYLSLAVILFLLPTTIGVIKALSEKRKFQCACLGTAFNLPLTKVTIVENLLMMAMSAMILF